MSPGKGANLLVRENFSWSRKASPKSRPEKPAVEKILPFPGLKRSVMVQDVVLIVSLPDKSIIFSRVIFLIGFEKSAKCWLIIELKRSKVEEKSVSVSVSVR